MKSPVDLTSMTPLEAGFVMPAEWTPHARCWMAWPCRESLWGDALPDTQKAYAEVARTIAVFEPVTMITPPRAVEGAIRFCGPNIEILPIEIDDSWMRDSGPTFLKRPDGVSAATAWHFNAWGGKFDPYENDARLAARLCDHLGIPYYRSSLHLEGGGINVDGEGTILTTESCVLNPNRNPGQNRREVERELCQALGGTKVIWLPGELADGDVTDGHIDGLASFVRPGVILLEGVMDPANPRHEVFLENRRALEGAIDSSGRTIEIVHIEEAWEARTDSEMFCRSYINYYLANGGVVIPAYGTPGDERARSTIQRLFPDRRVVQVSVTDIAIGGGGIHCITQQQPA